MKTSDFDFYLPEELIAQHPLEKRDYSKLMVLDKETGKIEHKHFYNVIEYFAITAKYEVNMFESICDCVDMCYFYLHHIDVWSKIFERSKLCFIMAFNLLLFFSFV